MFEVRAAGSPKMSASNKRSAAFADVPTKMEAGFPDQESLFPMGFLAPAGTPKKSSISGTARLRLGFDPIANTPEEFASWIGKEVPRWAKVIRDAHID